MYKGKHTTSAAPRRKRRLRFTKSYAMILALLVFLISVGSTLAFLTAETKPVTNTFTPSSVDTDITEVFDGNQKSSITVKNTGNTKVFVRVKLVSYRVNEKNQPIGGAAHLSVSLNDGWFEKDGYYYYSQAIDPKGITPNLLKEAITLVEYNDADGGKQAIDVMAEVIQADGLTDEKIPVAQAVWGVTVNGYTISK